MTVETYKIAGWKQKEKGLLIAENEDWVLVKSIVGEFAIDGYKLYAKSFLTSRKTKKRDKLIARVLQLKKVKVALPDGFEFGNRVALLQWSEQQYGLFEFQEESEEELFYGKINHIIGNYLTIDMITAKGEIEQAYEYQFPISNIRAITFASDYFNSIRLLMLDELGETV
ncbi:MAG: hypothetical protein AB8G15_01975 [Saprospiraceae bacterium]